MSLFSYREKPGYLTRLKEALGATRTELRRSIDEVLGTSESPITKEQVEDLEALLIGADIGIGTAEDILKKIRNETRDRRVLTGEAVRRMIREQVLAILKKAQASVPLESPEVVPHIIFMVGVNGVGKTTTLGKLAGRIQEGGRSVLICAADTFRAAAVEQLAIWSERAGAEIIRQDPGADPAAVLYDAIAAARARKKEVLLVDTAGRLHTKDNLMREIEKMKRLAGREVEGAPHQVILVLDATTGQNGLNQAREFLKRIGLTGLIVTKVDGTAKGGVVVTIARELAVPIQFLGTGEGPEDLVAFSPEAFVDSLLALE